MKDLAHNNVVRFVNVNKKNGEMFANFKVKGIRKGTAFSASISVIIDAANVDPSDPLEKIIEECARIGVKEFKQSEFEFEGMAHL